MGAVTTTAGGGRAVRRQESRSLTRRRSLPRAMLGSLLLAAVGAAQEPPAPTPVPATAKFAWYTQFGSEVLDVVDGVLIGRIDSIAPLRGTDVVRVTIVAWRFGERPKSVTGDAAEVTLLASPGDFFVGTEQLLFVKKFEGGPRYAVHNRVARSDPEWDAKVAWLDHHDALRKLVKDEDRRREVRKRRYDDLAARSNWTRWNSYHELTWLRTKHKDVVTWDDREDLKRLAERLEDAKLGAAVKKLLKECDS